jgi:hypothetical protein
MQCDDVATLGTAGHTAEMPIRHIYTYGRMIFYALLVGRTADRCPWAALLAIEKAALS